MSVAQRAHKFGRLNRGNYQSERSYQKWLAYGQSKLSNLLFAFELQRRAIAVGAPLVSVAAHPGLSDTNLWKMTPLGGNRVGEAFAQVLGRAVGQSAALGAWPLLRAATDPEVVGGEYFGPGGRQEWRGFPVLVPPARTPTTPPTPPGCGRARSSGRRRPERAQRLRLTA